jgi:hypothetical protein
VKKVRDFFTTLDEEDGQQRISEKLETDGGEYYGCSVDKVPLQQKGNSVSILKICKG